MLCLRDGGDLGAGGNRELHLHSAESAAGAGHQHPAAEQVAAEAQGAQCGQAGQRQCGDLLDAHPVWQRGNPSVGHGSQFGPAGLLDEGHYAGTRRRTGAVGCLLDDDPGDVLARPPLVGAGGEQGEFASVDRERPHRDERLIARRTGVVDVGDAGSNGCIQDGFHAFQPSSGTAGDQGAVVLRSDHES